MALYKAGRVTRQHMLLVAHACTTVLATAGCILERRDWQAKSMFPKATHTG